MGEPGSGKTVTLGHFAVELATRYVRRFGFRAHFPVILRAWDVRAAMGPDAMDPDLDALWPPPRPLYAPPAGLLRHLLVRGRVWLLLDGLDELGNPAEQAEIAGWFAHQVYNSANSFLLITSRTPVTALKDRPQPVTLMVAPLPPGDQAAFRRWLAEQGAGDVEVPAMEEPHQAWIQTPLGLTLCARLAQRDALPAGLVRADLYGRYLRTVLRLDTDPASPEEEALFEDLGRLAYGLHLEEPSPTPLPKALRPPRSAGILEPSDEGENAPGWRFVHPSFQEYLAAVHLPREAEPDTWLTAVWVRQPARWSPVAAFLTERLAGRSKRAFLETMADAVDKSPGAEAAHGLARCLLTLSWKENPYAVGLARRAWKIAGTQVRPVQPAADGQDPAGLWLADPRLGPGFLLTLTRPERDWGKTFWARAMPAEGDDDRIWRAWIAFVARLPSWHPALPDLLDADAIPLRWPAQTLCVLAGCARNRAAAARMASRCALCGCPPGGGSGVGDQEHLLNLVGGLCRDLGQYAGQVGGGGVQDTPHGGPILSRLRRDTRPCEEMIPRPHKNRGLGDEGVHEGLDSCPVGPDISAALGVD